MEQSLGLLLASMLYGKHGSDVARACIEAQMRFETADLKMRPHWDEAARSLSSVADHSGEADTSAPDSEMVIFQCEPGLSDEVEEDPLNTILVRAIQATAAHFGEVRYPFESEWVDVLIERIIEAHSHPAFLAAGGRERLAWEN